MKSLPPLKDKSAIVTGASRGIGRAIAVRMGEEGASVIVNYSKDEKSAQETVAAIHAKGGKAVAVQGDVSEATTFTRLFDAAIHSFGKADILVNNAGVILYKPLVDCSEEDYDRLFDINVKGTFFGCREAAKRLNEGGSIINLSSSTTAMMLPTYSLYCATKGAVEQITRVLAKELGPKKIRVNVVSPGPVETELFMEGKSPEVLARVSGMSAFNRIGQPEEIAEVVAFLAGHASNWVSGQNVRVNGAYA